MAVNGVPWWYFYGLGGPYEGRRLPSVDPGDVQWDGIGPQRVIGCVVYPAAEVPEPGVIELVEGDRFTLGEPSGKKTERAERLSAGADRRRPEGADPGQDPRRDLDQALGQPVVQPDQRPDLRHPRCICADPGTRAVARAMMVEAQAIAEKLGVRFPISVDKRIDGGAAVGAHKTSMLQDLERGRPMEIDALVTAVQEMGRLVEVPTPAIDAVLALVRLRARMAGCYPRSVLNSAPSP